MATSADYDAAGKAIVDLPNKPTDQELLKAYSLFKQATIGDNTTTKPGMLDFRGKAKWQAWKDREGQSKEEAEKEYFEFVEELKKKYS